MKAKISILGFGMVLIGYSFALQGGPMPRRIVAEIDPLASGAAAYEARTDEVSSNRISALVDFNLSGSFSTGPEVMVATYGLRGQKETDSALRRRQDLLPGEREKFSGSRLQWHFSWWEVPESMRGWFIKLAYSYTRIDSKANRFTDAALLENPAFGAALDPNGETDLVTDIRHGVCGGFGQRWMFVENKIAVSLEIAMLNNISRTVSVQSSDPQARSDYDELIERPLYNRFSAKPVPEASMRVGYSW